MIDPTRFIPITQKESGWKYNGPLSTFAEYHSLAFGLGAGITGEPALQAGVAAWALGRGSKSSADKNKASAHLRQITQEPAYAVGGMAIGAVARPIVGLF